MKLDLLIITGIVIMFAISLPAAYSEMHASQNKITLVVKYSDHTRIGYSFFINAKVFYTNQNPGAKFDQYYGFISNAKITAKILDPNGVQVKSFSGLTDNHGYYYQTFRIADNTRLGKYSVVVYAQSGDSTDSKKLVLFIQHKPY
ncbi:MAG TPA: MG2 domain-containing protein [Nitrosopumilaceae archaeon]|nr:MG2 domain-containing protein [Nitrosopumilaceae archaeon]